MDLKTKPVRLDKLIKDFALHEGHYQTPSYNEANTRTDFIDKFFELPGWDIANKQGYSRDYREVVREDRVHIADKPKAPDCSFRIVGSRQFFVEAKRPA